MTMMKRRIVTATSHLAVALLLILNYCQGFVFVDYSKVITNTNTRTRTSRSLLNVIADDREPILDKTRRLLQEDQNMSPIIFDEQYDTMIKSIFPDAINNNNFQYQVVEALVEKGFVATNTLLTTSLCSDELAKSLSDDFVRIYGSNFNLGGLAGFSFAGITGFQTMCGHIPDNGYCFFLFGPHIGITKDGEIGSVERKGVSINDICCRSAIEAASYVTGSSSGVVNSNSFTDFQQGAVQSLLSPLAGRLQASEYPMLELPYAIYDTQNELVESIISEGISSVKGGIAILGGIQINTGPDTLDYFHPIRFDFFNNRGELIDNMLSRLV